NPRCRAGPGGDKHTPTHKVKVPTPPGAIPFFRTAMAKTSNGPVTSESRLCEPVVRQCQKSCSREVTMMNRRQFCAATAGAALSMRIGNARAANFDLIIKGGRVI